MNMTFTHALATRIATNPSLVETKEDWSRVRSPGRALRRRAQGYRQNVAIITTPSRKVFSLDGGRTLVMHPEMERELQAAVAAKLERATDRLLTDAISGGGGAR